MPRRKPLRKSSTWGCSRGARTSWTARTTTVTDRLRFLVVAILCACAGGNPSAQDVRQRTRLSGAKRPPPRISEAQAAALTLTVSAVSPRLIQTWVRTAGTIDASGKILAATVSGPDAALVKVGQRVRA